jgi:hypothetical protein
MGFTVQMFFLMGMFFFFGILLLAVTSFAYSVCTLAVGIVMVVLAVGILFVAIWSWKVVKAGWPPQQPYMQQGQPPPQQPYYQQPPPQQPYYQQPPPPGAPPQSPPPY